MADPKDKKESFDRVDDLYQEKLSDVSDTLNRLEKKASQKETDSATEDIKKSEANPSGKATWKNTVGKKASSDTKDVHIGRQMLAKIHQGSAFAFILGLIVMGIGYTSIFAPNIILVNMKEMFTNDLADATVALYTYNKKMMDHKLGKADCSEKESIKCKLSTMSRQHVKRFEKAGFTVNGEKVEEDNLDDDDPSNDKPESRYKVSSIDFPHGGGSASDGDSFEQNTNKSTAMKSLVYTVFNPKSSFFMDTRYKERIKWRYDLTKNITVRGNDEDTVNESFNESMKGDSEEIDKAGRAGGSGGISLDTLKTDATNDQITTAAKEIGELANSYTQLQCGFFTIGKISTNASKTAKEQSAARFAMQYLKAADQVKAGVSDEITTNTLSGKLAWSSDGGYNGRNATDAVMYRHILFNEPAKDSGNGMEYYLDNASVYGSLILPWAQIVLTAKETKGITGAPKDLSPTPADMTGEWRETCLHGQTTQSKSQLKFNSCPALTMAAAPIPMKPAVAPIAAGSDRICPPPPKGIFLMYPVSTVNATAKVLSPYVGGQFAGAIKSWAENTAKNFTADTKGTAASDAIFAGTGAILGDMAMSRGMRPGDTQSMSNYLSAQADIDREFEEVARYDARKSPFDASNKYSFAGSFVRSLGIGSTKNTSFIAAIGHLFSSIPSSVSRLSTNASAFYYLQPLEFDSSRLRCPDAEYSNIGIDADVACNVRYSMSNTELDAKPNDVLEYMLESHPDETKDGISELQQRLGRTDPERDAADVARQVQQAQEGSNAKMIDEKTGKPVKHSEYEKFMTYCVNREDPWGRSGMVTRRDAIDEEEKVKRLLDYTKDLVPLTDDAKDPLETKDAPVYMSITEGTKADQDWYTGKKCLEESEMLNNFRAYTMMCSVDGSYSSITDCTEKDRSDKQFDGFYNNNDILYTSWW
jgi:hypothetical protein